MHQTVGIPETMLSPLEEAMPVILNVDGIIDWLRRNWRWFLSADRVGRNHSPELLVELWGDLDCDAEPAAICNAWEVAEWPLRCLDPAIWRELWESVGYVENGRPADRPKGPLTLYRGGHPHGWSWTDNLETAKFFANRPIQKHRHVYSAVVDTELLFAHIHDQDGRGEHEYVVRGDQMQSVRLEL